MTIQKIHQTYISTIQALRAAYDQAPGEKAWTTYISDTTRAWYKKNQALQETGKICQIPRNHITPGRAKWTLFLDFTQNSALPNKVGNEHMRNVQL